MDNLSLKELLKVLILVILMKIGWFIREGLYSNSNKNHDMPEA